MTLISHTITPGYWTIYSPCGQWPHQIVLFSQQPLAMLMASSALQVSCCCRPFSFAQHTAQSTYTSRLCTTCHLLFTWAARSAQYNTELLITLTPKGVVFSFVFLVIYSSATDQQLVTGLPPQSVQPNRCRAIEPTHCCLSRMHTCTQHALMITMLTTMMIVIIMIKINNNNNNTGNNIVIITMLSSSWWARYVQDKSCLSMHVDPNRHHMNNLNLLTGRSFSTLALYRGLIVINATVALILVMTCQMWTLLHACSRQTLLFGIVCHVQPAHLRWCWNEPMMLTLSAYLASPVLF